MTDEKKIGLLRHYARRFTRMRLSQREWWGVAFLLLNIPFGYGGVLVCSFLAEKLHMRWLHILGVIIYGLSWGMLFLGVYLAGPKVAKNCKSILPTGWKAYRRIKRSQKTSAEAPRQKGKA